jgi:hypothetical protein
MTKYKSKGGRPPKYKPFEGDEPLSDEQDSIIDEILFGNKDVPKKSKELETELTDEFVIERLKNLATQGNVKALELLGNKIGLFDSSDKDNLIDVFADEGTLEDNILKLLDVLEDKYSDIDVEVVLRSSSEALELGANTQGSGATQGAEDDQGEDDATGGIITAKLPEGASVEKTSFVEGLKDVEPEETDEDVFFPIGSLSLDPPIVDTMSGTIETRPQEDFSQLDEALKKSKLSRFR